MDVPEPTELMSLPSAGELPHRTHVCEVCGKPASSERTTYPEWKQSIWHYYCKEHGETCHQSPAITDPTTFDGRDTNYVTRSRQSRWLRAIAAVLSESNHPLTLEEIARAIIARQLIDSIPLWPEESIRSNILRHIERGGNTLGFIIVGTKGMRRYSMKLKSGD